MKMELNTNTAVAIEATAPCSTSIDGPVYYTVFPIVLRYVARYDVRNTLFAYNLYAIASISSIAPFNVLH